MSTGMPMEMKLTMPMLFDDITLRADSEDPAARRRRRDRERQMLKRRAQAFCAPIVESPTASARSSEGSR